MCVCVCVCVRNILLWTGIPDTRIITQVDEFCKDSDVSNLTPIGEYGLLIVWQWIENTEEDNDGGQSCESECLNQDGSLSTDSDLEEDEPTLNTVTFKCIGVKRDDSYQEALKKVSKLMQEGTNVPVKLVPEPTNPYDSRAISFQCQLDQQWHRIGYVVRELCECVHDAISSNSIVSTTFAWAKLKVVRTTGPGYYAAIDITRKGAWPPIVHRSANTMY